MSTQVNNHLKHWKWSLGETYYKSAKPSKSKEDESLMNNQEIERQQVEAINNSLSENTFFSYDNELIDITNAVFTRNQQNIQSKREDLDNKIADREMIAQRGVNPFLPNSNYSNDITTSDSFLKPVNTSTTTL